MNSNVTVVMVIVPGNAILIIDDRLFARNPINTVISRLEIEIMTVA